MTNYSDVPQVNTLYNEQQQVQSAIDYLSNGGNVTSMVVGPPSTPPDPGQPVPFQMPVSIMLTPPNSQDLIDQALIALKARDDAIYQELADLGVTNTPERKWKE
jgi:hypothetical protein